MSEKYYYIANQPIPLYKRDQKDSQWETLKDVFGGHDGATLKLDSYGQVDPLENGAEPGDVLVLTGIEEVNVTEGTRYRILEVMLPGSDRKLYTDARFIDESKLLDEMPTSPKRETPPKEDILARLEGVIGVPYIWAGKRPEGYEKMLEFYPPAKELDEVTRRKWTGAGLDCSKLIAYATNYAIPDTSRTLSTYGDPVDIGGKSLDEIYTVLQPLDLIVWTGEEAGHVMIVAENDYCIESRLLRKEVDGKIMYDGGVRKVLTRELLELTMKNRMPVNAITDQRIQFVVRRWIK